MTYNLPLLRKVQDWVATQMELSDSKSELSMASWRSVDECGTTYCVAGYVAEVSPEVTWATSTGSIVAHSNGDVEHVSHFAERELGLMTSEAYSLFNACESRVPLLLDHLIARAEACEQKEACSE